MNGETRGVSLIHEKIKQYDSNFDPMEVMKNLFDYRSSAELPEKYEELKTIFEDGVKEIAEPILDLILQHGCTDVVIYGAFISHDYFRKLIEKNVTNIELSEYVNRQFNYLKDEFKNPIRTPFEVSCNPDGGSSLLNGARCLIEEALLNRQGLHQLEYDRKELPCISRIGFCSFNEKKGCLCFDIVCSLFDAYVKQDTEVFIIKFRNTIDASKVENNEITKHNYKGVGIMEFERFCALEIKFKPDLKLFKKGFFLHGIVGGDNLKTLLHYQEANKQYFCHAFDIPRTGRKDRIPVNDIGKVFEKENDWNTWYGAPYYIEMNIEDKDKYSTIRSSYLNQIIRGRDWKLFKELEGGELTYLPEESLVNEVQKKKRQK